MNCPRHNRRLRTVALILAVLVLRTPGTRADERVERNAVIRLRDNTQVVGAILGIEDNAYLVRTQSLGTVRIRTGQIRMIEFPTSPGPVAETEDKAGAESRPSTPMPPPPGGRGIPENNDISAIDSLVRKMLANGDVMKGVEQLRDDPAIKEILADREIIKALESKDILSLLGNRKIWGLLENPTVKKISGQLQNSASPGDD